MTLKCPTCESPDPKLHPATQAEGEVAVICKDEFHTIKWYEEDKGFKRVKLNAPETKEEYAAWRVAVELEKRGITE